MSKFLAKICFRSCSLTHVPTSAPPSSSSSDKMAQTSTLTLHATTEIPFSPTKSHMNQTSLEEHTWIVTAVALLLQPIINEVVETAIQTGLKQLRLTWQHRIQEYERRNRAFQLPKTTYKNNRYNCKR